MATMTKTPSGESLERARSLLRQIDKNPKMRQALAAAMKAMGLPQPMPMDDPKRNRSAKAPK